MIFKNGLSKDELETRRRDRKKDIRSQYYRDTTAILHCLPFRRLKHKTQVFHAPTNDHICTRIEHVLHVASIATTICKGLDLDDEMAWAIGLGHDLGHAPFGHTGEKILSYMMKADGLGLFEHESNSLRVVEYLSPLNLTYAVRDGIVTHCGERVTQTIIPDFHVKNLDSIKSGKNMIPSTWEGCVVRISDLIAYLGRDWEDACRLGIVSQTDLPKRITSVIGTNNGEIINNLVEETISYSYKNGVIGMNPEVFEAVEEMKKLNYKLVYRSELLKGYEKYFERLLVLVVNYLKSLMDYGNNKKLYCDEHNNLALNFYSYRMEKEKSYMEFDGNLDRMVYDFVAGMTDNYCLDCGKEILTPEMLDFSIEQANRERWLKNN